MNVILSSYVQCLRIRLLKHIRSQLPREMKLTISFTSHQLKKLVVKKYMLL